MFTLAAFIVTKMIFPDIIYKKEMERLAEAKVGSIVQFGKYEQDNVTNNGMEPVEWIVLEKKENALLVISKNGLDCKRYNETDACVTWESSSMRIWLNNSFLCEAFSNEELNNIAAITVKAGENLKYDTNPVTDTQDRVFLLSMSEAESFFGSDSEIRCSFTAMRKQMILITITKGGGCDRPAAMVTALHMSAMTVRFTILASMSMMTVRLFAPLCGLIWILELILASYAYTSVKNGDSARQNLGKALYLYNRAADAYFGS